MLLIFCGAGYLLLLTTTFRQFNEFRSLYLPLIMLLLFAAAVGEFTELLIVSLRISQFMLFTLRVGIQGRFLKFLLTALFDILWQLAEFVEFASAIKVKSEIVTYLFGSCCLEQAHLLGFQIKNLLLLGRIMRFPVVYSNFGAIESWSARNLQLR